MKHRIIQLTILILFIVINSFGQEVYTRHGNTYYKVANGIVYNCGKDGKMSDDQAMDILERYKDLKNINRKDYRKSLYYQFDRLDEVYSGYLYDKIIYNCII